MSFETKQTVEGWVKTIKTKFNYIKLLDKSGEISTILNITDKIEINKISEASLVYFGTGIGVLSFEDACSKLKIKDNSSIINEIDNENKNFLIANYKLSIIVKVLNEGWEPDWADSNQRKYFPVFDLRNGLSFVYVNVCWNTGSAVGSRLVFKNEKLAEYAAKQFLSLYKDLHLFN